MSELTRHYAFSRADNELIKRAIKTVEKRFMAAENSSSFISPAHVLDYLRLQLREHDREQFLVLFLNNQNRLIATETLFSGSIDRVEVHPRIIARKALLLNATAIVIAHNPPSGDVVPSSADKIVTCKVKDSLALFDIRVLDHIITGPGNEYWSFTEHGQL